MSEEDFKQWYEESEKCRNDAYKAEFVPCDETIKEGIKQRTQQDVQRLKEAGWGIPQENPFFKAYQEQMKAFHKTDVNYEKYCLGNWDK